MMHLLGLLFAIACFFVAVIDVPPNEYNPALRRRIGGSHIAAIYGFHEFLTEYGLWLLFHGEIPPDEATDQMRLGKHLEQGIVSYAAELEKWDYEWCDRTIYSIVYPFMVYTPDALIPEKRWGIDAKMVSWPMAHRWGKTVDEIPDHPIMQGMWYMAGMDYDEWYVVALVEGEYKPRIYRIVRNARAEKAMLRKAKEWHERYIIGDERPAITDSHHTDRWLKFRYPRERTARVVLANFEETAMLEDYAEVRGAWECAEKRRRDLEARIKAAIGERAGLRAGKLQFTWKLTKDSQIVDWEGLGKSLLEAHPAAAQLEKEFTSSKPGSRRMYFKDKRGNERDME